MNSSKLHGVIKLVLLESRGMYCYYPLMQLLTLAFLRLSALLVDFSHFSAYFEP